MLMDLPTYERRCAELHWSEHKAQIIRRIAVERASFDQVAVELMMKVETVRKTVSREYERIRDYEEQRANDQIAATQAELNEQHDRNLSEAGHVLKSCVENREAVGGSKGSGEQCPIRVPRLSLDDYRRLARGGVQWA